MDAFAELELPRISGPSADDIARKFDRLTRQRHPDAGGDPAGFARLNEARGSSNRRRGGCVISSNSSSRNRPWTARSTANSSTSSRRSTPRCPRPTRPSPKRRPHHRRLREPCTLPSAMRTRESLEFSREKFDRRLGVIESAACEWDAAGIAHRPRTRSRLPRKMESRHSREAFRTRDVKFKNGSLSSAESSNGE